MAEVAADMTAALREIISHCAGHGGRTPSDFPLVCLTQAAVDRIAGDGPDVADIWPLTPLQAGMLFHTLVNAGSGAYLDQVCLTLDGVTDPAALAVAWQRTADRTPALRGRIAWDDDGQPVHVIARQATIPVAEHDLSGQPEADREAALDRLLAEDRAAGLDLAVAPLLRLTIARLGGDRAALAWTCHHLVLDGWSLGQVIAEVFDHYAAITGGGQPRLAARRPYRDYLRWLAGRDQGEAQEYWRGVLAGFTAPTPLPADRAPAQAHRTESAAEAGAALTAEQTGRLQAVARQAGLTLNTVVQGAWALLLSRYSGERDVVFGTTVSGRPAELPGVESMIGMFINTIPSRVTVRGDQPALDWLRDVQAAQAASRAHDYVALADLQAWSDLPPATSLFDSMVVYENYPFDDTAAAAGLTVAGMRAADTTSFPLTLRAYHDDRLHLHLAYDPALFDAATASQVTTRLHRLLAALADDPARPVRLLPWITAAERRQVITGNNPDGRPGPGETITAAFEAQAADTPHAIAVTCGPAALTYAELDAQSSRLAWRLIELGAAPERFVALALPRDLSLIVATIAVLKSGAAYLPVDPGYPPDRVAHMLRDAAPVALLSAGPSRAAGTGVPELRLDDPGLTADLARLPATGQADADRAGPLAPDSPAYVIYTSGSTGQPKGVVIPHANVTRLLSATRHWFGFGPADVWTLFHSYAFDFSVWEIWGPLLTGGRLVVVPHDVSRSPRTSSGCWPTSRSPCSARPRPRSASWPRPTRPATRPAPGWRCGWSSSAARPSTCGGWPRGTPGTLTPRRRWSTCTGSPRPPCTSATWR